MLSIKLQDVQYTRNQTASSPTSAHFVLLITESKLQGNFRINLL